LKYDGDGDSTFVEVLPTICPVLAKAEFENLEEWKPREDLGSVMAWVFMLEFQPLL
jgi:hypothetical protein